LKNYEAPLPIDLILKVEIEKKKLNTCDWYITNRNKIKNTKHNYQNSNIKG
jgi:hypothetical protein